MSYRRASYAMFSASVPWTSTRKGTSASTFNDDRLVSQADLTVTARVIIRTSGCGEVLQLFDDDGCSVVVSTDWLPLYCISCNLRFAIDVCQSHPPS